jgi:hypothetical protein
MQQRTPKMEIRDGEVWICLGHGMDKPYAILTDKDLEKLKGEIALNEHKRMAFVLDNIDKFAEWMQWRGNDPSAGKFLEVTYPWAHEGKKSDAKLS